MPCPTNSRTVENRDAPRRRVHASAHCVALDRRARALLAGELLGQRVELGGGDAGPPPRPQLRQDLGDDGVGPPHALDLLGRLEQDHGKLAATRWKMSSRLPTPEISRRSPASP